MIGSGFCELVCRPLQSTPRLQGAFLAELLKRPTACCVTSAASPTSTASHAVLGCAADEESRLLTVPGWLDMTSAWRGMRRCNFSVPCVVAIWGHGGYLHMQAPHEDPEASSSSTVSWSCASCERASCACCVGVVLACVKHWIAWAVSAAVSAFQCSAAAMVCRL